MYREYIIARIIWEVKAKGFQVLLYKEEEYLNLAVYEIQIFQLLLLSFFPIFPDTCTLK